LISELMSVTAEVTYVQPEPESAATLRTIVELVRSIMHADVASILSYSLTNDTVIWKAASGFRSLNIDHEEPISRPVAAGYARRALAGNTVVVFEGIGTKPELPAEGFPVHIAEGIHDLAVAPLRIQGNNSGAVTAGYRGTHHFTEDEKRLLQDLAEMASLALDNARLLETVREAETVWEQTFHAIDEGVLVYDRRTNITRCNARAAEMMDVQPSDVIGLQFSDAFARLFGKQAAAYYLAETRKSSAVFEVQTEGGRRNLVSIFPLLLANGESVSVVTLNDVTRLSEMQEQLGRSQRLASVGQLAAGVAHEINNPLAAITTCAEATIRDMRQSASTQKLADTHQWTYYLEEIVRQSMRCKEITRGLLDLTRQRQAQRMTCDLNSLAKQCAKVAVQRANSQVEFEVNLDEKIGEIATDPAMVRQILDNLFSNAVDAIAGPKGKVTVSTRRDDDLAVIEVADTGSGIPPDLMAKIFDPFFSTKGPGKGYGLGLAICSSLAESLGGGINVESREGEGSRFRLWIPRRAPE
jgi:PAS domain S-box-containing protein